MMSDNKSFNLDRSVVLVGLMGAGKTSIGWRLANRLSMPFVDSDTEIERTSRRSINDFFLLYGESAFRAREQDVVKRLLEGPKQVIATGGGAFMNKNIRTNIAKHGLSVWLQAEVDILLKRVSERDDRPLLKSDNPEEVLKQLVKIRYPVYAKADILVDSGSEGHDRVVETILDKIQSHIGN